MKRSIFMILTASLLMLIPAINVSAEIKMPSVFGDNMVLQQQTEAALWGKAAPNTTVIVKTSWNNRSYSVKSGADGKWRTKIMTPTAGGPYTVTISDGKPVVIRNVMIGEVDISEQTDP